MDLQNVLEQLEQHNRSCRGLEEMEWPTSLPDHPFEKDYDRYHRMVLSLRRISSQANQTRRWFFNSLVMDSRGTEEAPLIPEEEALRILDEPAARDGDAASHPNRSSSSISGITESQ